MKNKIKALLYCCKPKKRFSIGHIYLNNDELYRLPNGEIKFGCSVELMNYENYGKDNFLNGKIVAEVEIDEVEKIYEYWLLEENSSQYGTLDLNYKELYAKSCLEKKDFDNYLGERFSERKGAYALHLTNLKVFDKPLSFETNYIYKSYKTSETYKKAPQNMCSCYDRFGNKYVLISIQPQHLCNILNGKKTIEVRKQVLNCLKEQEVQ